MQAGEGISWKQGEKERKAQVQNVHCIRHSCTTAFVVIVFLAGAYLWDAVPSLAVGWLYASLYTVHLLRMMRMMTMRTDGDAIVVASGKMKCR